MITRLCSLMLALCCSAPLAAQHELPLLPFPKGYAHTFAELTSDSVLRPSSPELPALPGGRGEWALEGDMAGGAMVQTAWQGLLSALPSEPTGRRTLCKLHLVEPAGLLLAGALTQESLPERYEEAYVLNIDPKGVSIHACAEAGFFYALQTLRQLVAAQGAGLVSAAVVDWPAFPVRGFMHDCGRNFQSIESLKRQIDIASQLKLNYFHWHLSDYPAYHLECKKYPILNAPEPRTRDKADTYTYDQVRELIAFAKARHVTIIPEIDMPGHSDYFVRAFGFEMHTEQGMKVLEDILEEICTELPKEDCPIIHIGADEVSVPNAKEFIARMSKKLAEHGRTPMQWEGPWDLPVGERSIAQRWVQGKASQAAESIKQPTIDSSIGYSNLMDPALLVRRWFYMQPCGVAQGDELRRGAIFCTWPDRRVEDKSLIPLQSPQWPGMCAMAERAWVGGSSRAADAFPTDMPAPDIREGSAFADFEKRMLSLRGTIFKGEPFPYWSESARESIVVGPVPAEQAEAVRAYVLAGNLERVRAAEEASIRVRARVQVGDLEGLPVRKTYGGSLYFHTAPGGWNLGMFSQEKPGCVVWVITRVQAEQAGEAPFMLGFDAPLRSHQYYTGVPEPDEWSRCGTRLWLNGIEQRNPRRYSLQHSARANMAQEPEVPLDNEEIWWTQQPILLPLKQGENTLIIEQPYTTRIQSWSASIIPL